MNSPLDEKNWLEDFKEFMDSKEVPVPNELSEKILARVKNDLNPSPWIVFLKLFGIHSVVGTLSLAVCNQFGVSPFHTDISMTEYFMMFGHSFCMVLCGVLFLSLSMTFAWLFLRKEEFMVIRKNSFLQVFGLSAFSLGVFALLGAHLTITLGLLWLLGALIGGLVPTLLFNKKFIQVS